MRLAAACLGALLCLASVVSAQPGPAADPFFWLEDIAGARALRWVRTQNEFTAKMLKSDPDYAEAEAEAVAILMAPDRIAPSTLAGGQVLNFWQDQRRPHGLWRRTALADYQRSDVDWRPLLDLDALSDAQGENWVWKGAQCLAPAFTRCLVKLSRGGRDATVVREFDLANNRFVPDGFQVAEGKTEIAWVDGNTVLAATNWGADTLTRSGYARTVKVWRRGQASRDARTIYQGEVSDAAVAPRTVVGPQGEVHRFIIRALGRFGAELFYVDDDWRVTRISVPTFADFKGIHRGQLLFHLTKDWRTAGRIYLQGSVVSFSLARYLTTGGAVPAIDTLFMPGARGAVTAVATSKEAVYLATLDNVRGRLHELTFDGIAWNRRQVLLPDAGSIEIMSASDADADVLLKFSSFLMPDALYLVSRGAEPRMIRQLAERFDAYAMEVTQHEAVASDGARIPYFLVRKEGTLNNGKTPTLLYAYGGFQVSTTPWYWSSAGRLWLEKGGAYAVANVRGGGEFGPRWHEAARGLNRQKNFGDLAAVARDMIDRGVTSPRRLGLIGASQGALLATATFIQNPAMFNAVVAQVPLADMLRYPRLSAGASWLGEYGDPADPRQRASILRWSPYHNVRADLRYPRTFFIGATHDDRVHPAHARKMVARLQAAGQASYYFETLNVGHDTAGAPRQRAEQLALIFTYFRQQLMD